MSLQPHDSVQRARQTVESVNRYIDTSFQLHMDTSEVAFDFDFDSLPDARSAGTWS